MAMGLNISYINCHFGGILLQLQGDKEFMFIGGESGALCSMIEGCGVVIRSLFP